MKLFYKNLLFLVLLVTTLMSLVINPSYAVTLTLDTYPTSISDQPFEVGVSLLGASPGNNYLRIDLFKEGTTHYFGETYNGSNWYGGSEGTQYFPITIDNSEATISATVKARLGTPQSSEFTGAGNYKIRVRRYTSSGSPGSVDENTKDISISYSFPTLTPTPTPSPTATPTPSPTKPPSPTPTVKASLTPLRNEAEEEKQVKEEEEETKSSRSMSVLGTESDKGAPTQSPSPVTTVKGVSTGIPVLTLILSAIGVILLISCGILLYLKKKRGEL